MSQYGIFQAIFMSFYSRALYRDVAHNWGGKAFGYLLVLGLLSWIAFTFQVQAQISTFYAQQSDAYVKQIPVMAVKDGHLMTPEKRPYNIVDPKSHEVVAIIDTSGQYTTLEQANTDFLITETKIFSHPKKGEVREYDMPKTYSGDVIPEEINSATKKFIGFLWIPMFIGMVLLSYIYHVVQALVYGLLGMLFGKIQGVSLGYAEVMQIAIVALTPAIVISTILDAWHISFSLQLLVYFILEMAYLIFGIAANKEVRSI